MNRSIDISYPIGAFEDIREFILKEYGNIEDPAFVFTKEIEKDLANLASSWLDNAAQFVDGKEYDVAAELTKSALWLLEIMNKQLIKSNK